LNEAPSATGGFVAACEIRNARLCQESIAPSLIRPSLVWFKGARCQHNQWLVVRPVIAAEMADEVQPIEGTRNPHARHDYVYQPGDPQRLARVASLYRAEAAYPQVLCIHPPIILRTLTSRTLGRIENITLHRPNKARAHAPFMPYDAFAGGEV
jgi:hypothetical protein